MDKFVNPETIAKMQSDIKKKAGLNTNNTFKGNNNFEKAPTINGEAIATVTPDGTNYLMVYGVGTPTENAAELQAAYEEAKIMPRYMGNFTTNTPIQFYKGQTFSRTTNNTKYLILTENYNGSPIGPFIPATEITEPEAKSVRTTVIVAPGNYIFDALFVADSSGIDIISLTGEPNVILNATITATNATIKGIKLVSGTFEPSIGTGKIINCINANNDIINPIYSSQFTGNTITQPNGTQGNELASCGFVQNTLSKSFILEVQANLTNVVDNGKMVYNSTDKKMYLSNGEIYTAYNVAERIYQINGGKYYKKYKGSFYQEEVEFASKNNSELTGNTIIQKLAIGIGNINPNGTISSITNGVVTGNGTKFTTEFYVGAKIYFPSVSGGAPQTISSITDDLTLTITNTSASVPPDSSYSGDLERALNVGFVILEFADNAAAVTGGLVNGDMYRTADVLKVVHT